MKKILAYITIMILGVGLATSQTVIPRPGKGTPPKPTTPAQPSKKSEPSPSKSSSGSGSESKSASESSGHSKKSSGKISSSSKSNHSESGSKKPSQPSAPKDPGEREVSWDFGGREEEEVVAVGSIPSSETINGINVRWAADVTPAQYNAISKLINNMVTVDGGTFVMGSSGPDTANDEGPEHEETVGTFKINKYETTQKLWESVMGSNPSASSGANFPVEKVSYESVMEFIKKLNRLTGLNFRLPTEAEWEFAARGGNQSHGYRYSGSADYSDVAWHKGNSDDSVHTVGTQSPNELGLYDMSGNVWEWTSDKYNASYILPRDASELVYRGGGYNGDGSRTRVTIRSRRGPTFFSKNLGFRLAL